MGNDINGRPHRVDLNSLLFWGGIFVLLAGVWWIDGRYINLKYAYSGQSPINWVNGLYFPENFGRNFPD